jgi:hypothetical protein
LTALARRDVGLDGWAICLPPGILCAIRIVQMFRVGSDLSAGGRHLLVR